MDLQERVRQLAAAGGDLSAVRTGLDRALRLSLAYDLAAISTVDPATMLWTSCFISGMPPGGEDERERILYGLEFDGDDINSYTELANSGQLVGRLHQATDGDLSRATRREHRARRTDRDGRPVPPGHAAGRHRNPLELGTAARDDRGFAGRRDHHRQRGPRKWLDVIDDRDRIPSVVRSVAAAAAAGDGLAHAVFPVPEGRWVILHGSPLGGRDGGVGIIIEGAQPVTLSEVIAGAYGLTPREREVTSFAAQGRSTKQIASALGISPFTVQDHLKAVFAKVGVQSRAELVAALYVRHYEPRRTAGSTPGPYGWYLDDYQAAAG